MSLPGAVGAPPRSTGRSAPNGSATVRSGRRRVRLPRVAAGVLIVLIGAVAGAQLAGRIDDRVPVLAVARPVKAGQVLTDADLTEARVSVDAAVSTTPASAKASVLGRTAAMPLAKGALLGQGQVGAPVWPAAGEALAAVAVKAGRAPGGLAAGMRVTVFVVPPAQAGAGGGDTGRPVQADATIASVQPAPDQSGGLLVTVVTQTDAAQRIAAAPGDAVLVQLGAGG